MLACSNGDAQALVGLFIFTFICFVFLLAFAVNILYVIAFCKIFQKAGFNWALGLLMLVPIANLIMPFVLGFGDWPIEKELRALKQKPKNP